jgi:hypothetical protein
MIKIRPVEKRSRMNLFFYVCRQVGLTSEDMEEMTIGDCLDYVQEYIDNQKKDEKPTARKATQEDFDNF